MWGCRFRPEGGPHRAPLSRRRPLAPDGGPQVPGPCEVEGRQEQLVVPCPFDNGLIESVDEAEEAQTPFVGDQQPPRLHDLRDQAIVPGSKRSPKVTPPVLELFQGSFRRHPHQARGLDRGVDCREHPVRFIGQNRDRHLTDTAPYGGVCDDDPVQRVFFGEFPTVGVHPFEEFLRRRASQDLAQRSARKAEVTGVECRQDRPDGEVPVFRRRRGAIFVPGANRRGHLAVGAGGAWGRRDGAARVRGGGTDGRPEGGAEESGPRRTRKRRDRGGRGEDPKPIRSTQRTVGRPHGLGDPRQRGRAGSIPWRTVREGVSRAKKGDSSGSGARPGAESLTPHGSIPPAAGRPSGEESGITGCG